MSETSNSRNRAHIAEKMQSGNNVISRSVKVRTDTKTNIMRTVVLNGLGLNVTVAAGQHKPIAMNIKQRISGTKGKQKGETMNDCISIRNGYKKTDLYFAEATKPLEEFECNKNMGDDNISRKAILEAIDKLTKFVEIWRSDNSTEIVLSENDVCNAVKQLPSAQPEIIYCKDCLMHGVCRYEQRLGLDGYCSQAERITDEC